MRTLRTVLSALVVALLLVGGLSTSAGAGSLPKRVIEEVPPKTKQVSYNAFKLKGTVAEPQLDGTLLPYANAMKQEASKKTVEVQDLNLRSIEYYTSVGNTYLATNIFDGGTTHFVKAGAVKMAELVVGEIRKNNGPLAAFLK